MSRCLYILGNGFDLAHGLPTGYKDFLQFIKKSDPSLSDTLNEYLIEGDLWTNFEEALGLVNVNHILQLEETEAKEEEEEPEREYALIVDRINQNCQHIKDTLIEQLKEWIQQINISPTAGVKPKYSLLLDSIYLTFNYTNTLEVIYNIPPDQILHIHGTTTDPIFGHNASSFTSYKDSPWVISDEAEDYVKALFESTHKNVTKILKQHDYFFTHNLANITKVRIIGHSLNDIDLPYIRKIATCISPQACWQVSYFKQEELQAFSNQLQKIGIPLHQINLKKA